MLFLRKSFLANITCLCNHFRKYSQKKLLRISKRNVLFAQNDPRLNKPHKNHIKLIKNPKNVLKHNLKFCKENHKEICCLSKIMFVKNQQKSY